MLVHIKKQSGMHKGDKLNFSWDSVNIIVELDVHDRKSGEWFFHQALPNWNPWSRNALPAHLATSVCQKLNKDMAEKVT